MKLKNALLVLAILFCGGVYADEAYTKAVKVQTLLKTSTDSAGRKLEFPTGDHLELSEYYVEVPSGQSTGWHVHPNPCIAHVLEGTITVEDERGVKRHYKAGDSFAEVVNLKHNGTNTGTTTVKILLFVVGRKGVPVSVK